MRSLLRNKVVLALIAVVLVGTGAGVGYDQVRAGGTAASPGTVIFSRVQTRTLQDTLPETGTLGHKTTSTITAAAAGQVTALYSQENAIAKAGDPMFAIGGRTAIAEEGSVPFFRSLGLGDEGSDVLQLNEILAAARDDPGPVGSAFTDGTLSALAEWQAQHGYPDATPASAQSVTLTLQPGSGYGLGDEATAGLVIQPPAGSAVSTSAVSRSAAGSLLRPPPSPAGVGSRLRLGGPDGGRFLPHVAPDLQISGTTAISPGGYTYITISSDVPVPVNTEVFLTVTGTAVVGTDYQALSPVVTIPAGATSASFPVVALASQLIEPNPVIIEIALSTSPTGSYTVAAPSAAVVTIAPATGSASVPIATLTSPITYLQKGKPYQVTISLTQAVTSSVEINLTYGGTAAIGTDFTSPGGTVTVPAGQTSATITIPTISDNLVEADRELTVTLATGTGYTVGTPSSTQVTITNTRAPMLEISGTTTVSPGGTAALTITADQAPVQDTQVVLAFTGDAQSGTDYESVSPTVDLPAGSTSLTVEIDTLNDHVLQPDRHVVVSIQQSSSQDYTLGSPSEAVVTIAGASGASALPVVNLTSATTYLQKGKPYQVTIGLNQALTVPLIVNLSYAGSARDGPDYTLPGGEIEIPAGQTSLAVTIPTVADNVVEPDRQLTVALVPSSSYLIAAPSSASVTITSAVVPTLTLSSDATSVPAGGQAVFTITADQAPAKNTSVAFVEGGTAQPGRNYQALVGTVILRAGQTRAVIDMQTLRTDIGFDPTDMIVGQWPVRVGEVYVKVGDTVAPGDPILDLTERNSTVLMQASASDRTQLAVGQSCTMTIAGGQAQLSGTIAELDSEPTVITGSSPGQASQQVFEGRIQVSNLTSADAAADGASVAITVVVQQATDALTVPIAAVKQNGTGQDVVRVVDLSTGHVSEVPVTTGLSAGSYIQVSQGLHLGQTVIVSVANP